MIVGTMVVRQSTVGAGWAGSQHSGGRLGWVTATFVLGNVSVISSEWVCYRKYLFKGGERDRE